MIKIQLKLTVGIVLPINYTSNATIAEIKTGVKADVKLKIAELFVNQADLTFIPPAELVLMSLEDTLD